MFDDKSVSYFTYLNCIVIGFAGNNFLPARGGELLRMEFLKDNLISIELLDCHLFLLKRFWMD